MPNKPKRHMRCIDCGSLRTRKNGKRVISPVSFDRRTKRQVQRYECLSCGSYFGRRTEPKKKKYTFHFKVEIARMHVEERLSYRVIAKRVQERLGKRVSPTQLCKMVNEVAEASKSSVEIKREYRPVWSGYLTIDDKWVCVKGDRFLSLVAVDGSGDPLHSELHSAQTQDVYDEFLVYVRDHLSYPFKAITTDFDTHLEKAVQRVLSPDIAHQKCLWHGIEIVQGLIEYPQSRRRYMKLTMEIGRLKESLADRKQSLYDTQRMVVAMEEELITLTQQYQEKKNVVERFRAMVFATRRSTSERLYKVFRRLYRKRYASVVRFVATPWEALLRHQQDPKIFKTTVRAENINRQFERCYKTIEAFQSVQTAFHYQNLYRNYLRMKPYTDCRGVRKACNGFSPLELCKAAIPGSDWLKHTVRFP